MKLFLPDPLHTPSQLSGSSFLYFNDDKIGFTLHPTVSVALTGMDPINFYKFVEKKKPSWFDNFNLIFNLWLSNHKEINTISKIIEPLKDDAFVYIWFIYPKNNKALDDSQKIIESTKLSFNEVFKFINPSAAANELMAHLLFEKFLEIYHSDKSEDEISSMRKDAANKDIKKLPANFDYTLLYEYCNDLFSRESIEEMLSKAYLFRLPFIKSNTEFLLSNENLLEFLNLLPIEIDENINKNESIFIDSISWELFKQILSKYSDEINKDTIKAIKILRNKRNSEIDRLKLKCVEIAGDFYGERDYKKLQSKISLHVKTKIEKEIKELLCLDNDIFNDYLASIFSDEKSWIAISAFIISLLTDAQLITASSAIAVIANLGAKAVKIASETNKKIKQSDYSIIYRMNKK